MKNTSRGNVLFLILIAVALFAALSYAVTQSTRGGGSDANKESASTEVARFLQYSSMMSNFILRAQVSDNVPDYGFSQQRYGVGTATVCNGYLKCTIFNGQNAYNESGNPQQAHGLYTYKANPKFLKQVQSIPEYQITLFTARVANLGMADKAELILGLIHVSDDFCKEMNKQAGLGEIIPHEEYDFTDYSTSTQNFPEPAVSAGDIGDQVTELAGKPLFCVEGYLGNVAMSVLITR